MKEIKSLEDLKERKEKILSLMEDSFKHSVESLREIIKLTESSDDLQKEFAQFEEGLEALSQELDSEGERIDNLPGVKEDMGSFQEEMEERLGPYAQELEDLAKELMKIIEKAFKQGFGDLFSALVIEGDEKKDV